MDLQTIQLFAEYNAKTNEKMNAHVAGLDEEQWTRDLDGFFSSVRSQCSHVYTGDFNWLKRFSKLRPFGYIGNEVFKDEKPFSALHVTTVEDYLAKRRDMDRHISAFVGELEPEDLTQALPYVDSSGTPYTRNFGGLILHMFNHQTHHRGMISLFLEQLGIDNDYSNLYDVL